MKTVYLVTAPGEAPSSRHEVADVSAFIMSQFGHKMPKGLRIYHKDYSIATEVTPRGSNPASIKKQVEELRQMPGPFYVVKHALADPITWAMAIVAVIAVAAAVLLRPKVPNVALKSKDNPSPNNSLSERTNEPRVNGRVAEIVGTNRSTPDSLGPPYNIYVDNVKREIAYMCIGVGHYQIHDLRDDTTDIAEIAGASAEVYGPNTSPNTGDAPQIRVGDPIGIPLLINKRIDAVNGQPLLANDAGSISRQPVRFEYPNRIVSETGEIDFTETFVPGDLVVVTGAAQSDGEFVFDVPDNGAWFSTEKPRRPSWGEMSLPGDLTADWAAGQYITLTNCTVTYEVQGGEDGPSYQTSVNLNGMYEIISVDYKLVDSETEETVPPTVMRTVIRLDVSSNNSAWSWQYMISRYAFGGPLISRPSNNVLFELNGTYTIVTVAAGIITLNSPETVNSDWIVLRDNYGGVSNTLFPILSTFGERWIGWITIKHPRAIDRIIANFLAPSGMFGVTNDGDQRRLNVTYLLQAERLDANANPTGDVREFIGEVSGSAVTRSSRANTLNEVLGGIKSKNWRYRARRLSPSSSNNFSGEVVDEIIWNDLYVASEIGNQHFGNVTTVYTATSATEGATGIKSRRFNTLVTRKIPLRISGDQFTEDLHPTNKASEILAFLALDPHNGRRTKDQIDFDSIYDTYDQVVEYFGTPLAAEFCYTFDSDSLSFDEIATQVAQWGLFSQAYRRGSKLRLYFEKRTDQRAMLFNHRNVLPNSEEASGSWGLANAKGSDGVQFQWFDPETDAVANIQIPADGSALSPLKTESIGVRNHIQAHFHSHRIYQKIKEQRRSKTFDSLHIANLLIPKNVVLCADGCRPETISGSIVQVDGLVLYLDRDIDFNEGSNYSIFLQTADVATDSIAISPGPTMDSVILSRPPSHPLNVGNGSAFSSTYSIVNATTAGTVRPYIISEMSDKRNMTTGMQVVEYSDALYNFDKDYINGIIQ